MDHKLTFYELKQKTEEYYKTIGKIYSPAILADIYFNSDGFHHLRFDGTRAERSKFEQKNKLNHIKHAVEVIKKSTTIQEYRITFQPVGKAGLDGFRKTAKVEYFAFTAILGDQKNLRIKAIVKKIGNSNYHFWSVMPYWINQKISADFQFKKFGTIKIEDE